MVKLIDIPSGVASKIAALTDHGPLSRRLNALGLRPGAEVVVLRRTPLGGPLVVAVGRTQVSLRRGVAATVLLEPA